MRANVEIRPIVGFRHQYAVSRCGRVWSRPNAAHNGIWLKPSLRRGYPFVDLYKSPQEAVSSTIHTLVAEAFIGRRPRGMQINHIDCNKKNNAASNIEYVTAEENIKHAHSNGLVDLERVRANARRAGTFSNGPRNFKPAIIRRIRLARKQGKTMVFLAKKHGISNVSISRIVSFKTYRAI